ncbi:odorant receptor 4-like isoform X3 [Rhynchophorus ferrugineus]
MATVFFQILCGRFRNVMDKLDENNEEILRRIKKCVIYYNATIEYVSMIQNTFSYGILIQFLCSVIIICLTVFQLSLVVDYNSTKFVLMIIYLLCMMFQVSLYCWYGHILMEKSNEITAACYAINWNDLDLVNQKLLITIMERAKRPVELNALGVFKLNLSTMVTILRTSYSYFAVLQQIYKK